MLRAQKFKKWTMCKSRWVNKQRDGNFKTENQTNQLEISNIVREMKNALSGLASVLDNSEKRINDFEDVSIETSQTEIPEDFLKLIMTPKTDPGSSENIK